MKRLTIALALCLVPMVAAAGTFTASLAGDTGSGFANLMISGDTINYTIMTSGLNPAATSASMTDGHDTIDLEASFTAGSSAGSITSSLAADVAADPESWTVAVTNGTDALSGTLAGAEAESTTLVFPVAANVTGLAGTNYLTDARILNMGSAAAVVNLDYYEEGAAGHTSPSATSTVTLAAGQEAVINDIVGSEFDVAGTKGAVVAMVDQKAIGSMRIYNDQSDAGLGTFGQYVKGMSGAAPTMGTVLFLSNEDPATAAGYRTNLGWFNPNTTAVTVTFVAYDADGTMLDSASFTVNAMAQEQFPVASSKLFPSLDGYGDFYVMYSIAGADGLFVYGSLVDNVNGDAIYVAAE